MAIGELAALGIINYQKSQVKALTIALTPSPESNINTPIPDKPVIAEAYDYLSVLKTSGPSPQVESIKLTASPKPSPTPLKNLTPTPTTSPIVTPSPLQSSTPTPVKTPTSMPQIKYSSQEINSYIDRFAGQYSVDPNIIRHIALCESGFNANAKYLSYGGLFQFSTSTWQSWRRKMGEDINADLRFNAEEAVQTAAYVISKGSLGIWPNCKP